MSMTRLAISSLVLGFLFIRLVFMEWRGVGVTLFTGFYILMVLWALRRHKVKLQHESYFWLGVLVLTALSYSLWGFEQSFLALARAMLLLASAVYWVLVACGMGVKQMTSDYLPLDFWHGFFNIPLGNMGALWRQLSGSAKTKMASLTMFYQVVAGIFLAGILLSILGPLLMSADVGGFTAFFLSIGRMLQGIDALLIIQIILALPTGSYIYGLLDASIGQRRLAWHNENSLTEMVKSWPNIPAATIYVTATLLLGTYLVFLLAQWPVLVAGLSGEAPTLAGSAADYARRGFFELCWVAFINLSLLAGASLFARGIRYISHISVALSLVTLVLAVLAWSRLAWYVHLFGLTIDRVLASAFLLGLAIIFLAIVLRSKYHFSIMRVASFTASIILLVLLLSAPYGRIASYNAERYLDRTLPHFDPIVLNQAGTQGVGVALRLREHTGDLDLYRYLGHFLEVAGWSAARDAGTHRDTYDAWRARRLLFP